MQPIYNLMNTLFVCNKFSFEDKNRKLHAGLGSKKGVHFPFKDMCIIVLIVSARGDDLPEDFILLK